MATNASATEAYADVLDKQSVLNTLYGASTTLELVDNARGVISAWLEDPLFEYDGPTVKTGILLLSLLNHASKDPIPFLGENVTGERHTASLIVVAGYEDATIACESSTDSCDSVVRRLAVLWFERMLFCLKWESFLDSVRMRNIDTWTFSIFEDFDWEGLVPPAEFECAVKRARVLKRDGFTCNIHPEELDEDVCKYLGSRAPPPYQDGIPLSTLVAAHILPRSLALHSEPDSAVREDGEDEVYTLDFMVWGHPLYARLADRSTSHLDAARSMLQNWASLGPEEFDFRKMHDESNLVLICSNEHRLFNLFTLFFDPTPEGIPDRYLPMQSFTSIMAPRWGGAARTFRNHSADDRTLPSPKLLAVHAALSRVFWVSHTGRYFNDLVGDYILIDF